MVLPPSRTSLQYNLDRNVFGNKSGSWVTLPNTKKDKLFTQNREKTGLIQSKRGRNPQKQWKEFSRPNCPQRIQPIIPVALSELRFPTCCQRGTEVMGQSYTNRTGSIEWDKEVFLSIQINMTTKFFPKLDLRNTVWSFTSVKSVPTGTSHRKGIYSGSQGMKWKMGVPKIRTNNPNS